MKVRFRFSMLAIGMALLSCVPALALGDPMAGIEIVSIKQMQVRQNSNGYYFLDIVVNMRNSSGSNLRLKENAFNLAIGAERKGEVAIKPRYIGKAEPEIIELKNVKSTAEPCEPVQLIVGLGAKETDVLEKLAFVMNTVGNPVNKVNIAISGKTKSWKQVENGWISPGPMEMELIYHPKIEREVLIE